MTSRSAVGIVILSLVWFGAARTCSANSDIGWVLNEPFEMYSSQVQESAKIIGDRILDDIKTDPAMRTCLTRWPPSLSKVAFNRNATIQYSCPLFDQCDGSPVCGTLAGLKILLIDDTYRDITGHRPVYPTQYVTYTFRAPAGFTVDNSGALIYKAAPVNDAAVKEYVIEKLPIESLDKGGNRRSDNQIVSPRFREDLSGVDKVKFE